MRKLLIVLLVSLLILPAVADYDPMSDEPITNPEEFWGGGKYTESREEDREEVESPEFEYPSSQNAPSGSESKATKNYPQIYNDLEPANFAYMHDIDPDQYYDMKDASWAPYPLLRLNSYIYFKDQAIEPGYYLLTPREHQGKWYLLFKQNGKVSHIIPVYERDLTPEFFYDKHLPKPKLTTSQKIHMNTLDFLGKFKSTKRKEPIKSYMEINDLENYFVSIIIYYGNHKYSTIFRTIKL